jgi:hypothetical protein
MARGENTKCTKKLLDNLKWVANQVSEHARAVMVGGMSTDATRSPPAQACADCGSEVVPSLEHVLWECAAYAHLRVLPPPPSALARRLGWSAPGGFLEDKGTVLRRVVQMGRIRELEAERRLRRLRGELRGGLPGELRGGLPGELRGGLLGEEAAEASLLEGFPGNSVEGCPANFVEGFLASFLEGFPANVVEGFWANSVEGFLADGLAGAGGGVRPPGAEVDEANSVEGFLLDAPAGAGGGMPPPGAEAVEANFVEGFFMSACGAGVSGSSV